MKYRYWHMCLVCTQGETTGLLLRSPRVQLSWVGTPILGRWSWKCCMSVILGETALHLHCSGLPGDRGHPVGMTVYLKDGPEKTIHRQHWRILCTFIVKGLSGWYDIFTQKMILEVPFIGDTIEDSAHPLFISPRTELFELVWWSWKDFRQFSLLESVVVLKGLILDNFNLGEGCSGLKRTNFHHPGTNGVIWLKKTCCTLKWM